MSDDSTYTSRIILLNGVSSSGKSSIAKELQKLLDAPYLHVCIDAFEEMMPDLSDRRGRFADHKVFNRMLSGFHHSLAALAARGSNLIIDHVLVEGEDPADWTSECLTLLAKFDVLMVGVRCSLEELERREQARGDRPSGLSRWQYSRMHLSVVYDLEVDTVLNTPRECALQIADAAARPQREGLNSTLTALNAATDPSSCSVV